MYIQYVADILCFTVMHIHTQYNEFGNVNNRVPTHSWKSFKFRALKVLEKRTSAWKSHRSLEVLEFTTRSNCVITKFIKQHLYRTGMHIILLTNYWLGYNLPGILPKTFANILSRNNFTVITEIYIKGCCSVHAVKSRIGPWKCNLSVFESPWISTSADSGNPGITVVWCTVCHEVMLYTKAPSL